MYGRPAAWWPTYTIDVRVGPPKRSLMNLAALPFSHKQCPSPQKLSDRFLGLHVSLIAPLSLNLLFKSFCNADLQEAIANYDMGKLSLDEFRNAQDRAAEDSVKQFEAAGQPIVTDGEQRASS